MPIRVAALLVCVVLLSACDPFWDDGSVKPLEQVPGPSDVQAVGTITGQSQRDTTVKYELADGRVITVDLATRRMVGNEGGSPAILVLGRDDRGEWIAVPGHQDGLPDGCHVLSQDGFELGDSIAIAGVRWPKAPEFAPVSVPALGFPYPAGTRFCLDEQARVEAVISP